MTFVVLEIVRAVYEKSYSENLDAIFNPTSIAVVGASTRPGTVGNDLFHNLLSAEFQGVVYPVNPKSRFVAGVYGKKPLRLGTSISSHDQ